MFKQYRVRAWLWFAFMFCTLGAGHYLFFRFSFHPLNSLEITRGLAFGTTLWSTVLLIAMMMHRGWARYVLATGLVLAILAFGMAILVMNSRSIVPLPGPTKMAVLGLVCYALALVPLGVSTSIRRYLAPRTAGGF